MFDTGGGITLLSQHLCQQIGCVPDGTYTGKRMSGQDITLPMARVSSITIAGHRVTNARVAVLDTSSLLHPDLGVEGVAAMDLFRDQPFIVDHPAQRFVVENEASLRTRRAAGHVARLRVENDGPLTVVYLSLALIPGAPPLEMEVDSGSLHMILEQHFMAPLGIDPSGEGVKRIDGKDETGNPYVRFFASLPRTVAVVDAPSVTMPAGTKVMFQTIIHDGLVGQEFLRRTAVTFDTPHSSMLFSTP
jgi:hypothetical protein